MSLTPVAQQDAEVLTVPTERLRTVLDTDPQLRDVVLRTYLLRRSYLIEQTAVKVVGSEASSDARRLREFLTARDSFTRGSTSTRTSTPPPFSSSWVSTPRKLRWRLLVTDRCC